jgi:hypothetical protein
MMLVGFGASYDAYSTAKTDLNERHITTGLGTEWMPAKSIIVLGEGSDEAIEQVVSLAYLNLFYGFCLAAR